MDPSENPKSEIRNPKSDGAQPSFDWRVYADATCAGLALLIPLPFVDLVFEGIFRRRIPQSIARARGRLMTQSVRRALGRAVEPPGTLRGCLSMLAKALLYIVRRIWRKIIYVLAVKDAVTSLTRYWHRASLIDHMVRAGHLEPGADTGLAADVFARVLQEIDPSPLRETARQTVANVHHVVRLLAGARRLGAAAVTRELGRILGSHWETAEASLAATAERYNRAYRAELQLRAAEALAGGAASGTMAR
jgi:hypothetical protein